MQTNFSENLLLILTCALGYCACAPARSYYDDYATRNYRRPQPSAYNALYSRYYTPAAYNPRLDRYHSSRYREDYRTTTTTTTTRRPRAIDSDKGQVDRADAENAKFAGASNQELEDVSGDERTLLLKKKLRKLRRLHGYGNPCIPFGRDAATSGDSQYDDATTPKPTEQGRFLFDVNVYKVYQQPGIGGLPLGCGGGGYGGLGYGGGLLGGGGGGGLLGGGGGLLSDPLGPIAPYPVRPVSPFATWLSLFAPGVLQNSLAATVRPLSDPGIPVPVNNLQNDPDVDPNYSPVVPLPTRRPNRVYYDSGGAPPVTPGQLLGGVATTVNGIIQQLTGNVQPVYQSAYRTSRSYG